MESSLCFLYFFTARLAHETTHRDLVQREIERVAGIQGILRVFFVWKFLLIVVVFLVIYNI